MFMAKDKNGQQIYLRDTVSYEAPVDDMGLLGKAEGVVLSIPSEQKVQVQSLNGGAPELLDADALVVTYSLIASVAALSSNEELQKLVLAAELRYGAAVAATKTKRGGGRGKAATKKADAEPNPFELAAAAAKKKEEDML